MIQIKKHYDLLVFWAKNTNAASAIEYSLLAAAVALAIASAIFLMSDSLLMMYGAVETSLSNAATRVNTS